MKSLLAVAILFSIIVSADSCGFAQTTVPTNANQIRLNPTGRNVATWSNKNGQHYAIQKDKENWHVVENTSYSVRLRYETFDPLVSIPTLPPRLRNLKLDTTNTSAERENTSAEQVYIVQFVTQPIEEYRQQITDMGGVLHKYLPHHSYLVRLSASEKNSVAKLPFVRWIGLYQPAYKIDENLLASWNDNSAQNPIRLNVMVHQRGPAQKKIVIAKVKELGGIIHAAIPDGFILETTLTPDQLATVAAMPEVAWIDPWSKADVDMDRAREIGGANFVETIAGYSGQGVRGEVMDTNLFDTHIDFQSIPPIFHGPRAGSDDHGTGTYGITFGSGTGNSLARGMLPNAQGIFADYGQLNNRYAHSAELVTAPYFCVFQSNSWGNGPTTSYTSNSAQMDDIIFLNDIVITQSQSNQNSQLSRPQAWAKNIVSVGGINHQETLTKTDDFWGGASFGPAADGRVKPDLCHFYDSIFTVDDSVGGYRNFCCTSGATPIVAGHFGLFFQMWSDGIFGNAVDRNGTVFENRPHSTTARAMVINNACSYSFNGTNANLARIRQGWGMPDLQRLHQMRMNTFIVNEDIALQNLETAEIFLNVPAGTPEFRATMVYLEPMGTTSSTLHRINDLSLRVTAPNGDVYWGNNGLLAGNFSTSGGSANSVDPVENVFLQNPSPGSWTVEVIANEINEDAKVETSAVDADFALVVTGITTIVSTVDDLAVNNGDVVGGDLDSILFADENALNIVAEAPDTDSTPVSIDVSGTFGDEPNTIQLLIRSQGNTPGLATTVELFNYDSNQFVAIGSGSVLFGETENFNVSIEDNAAEFAEDGTGRFLARISFETEAPALMFPWQVSIDQIGVTAN